MLAYEKRTDVTLPKFKHRERQTYPIPQLKCSQTLSVLQKASLHVDFLVFNDIDLVGRINQLIFRSSVFKHQNVTSEG